jgi:hypothetical protein
VVPTTLLACFSRGSKEGSLWEGKLCMDHQAGFIRFKKIHSDCSYEFIPTEQIILEEE